MSNLNPNAPKFFPTFLSNAKVNGVAENNSANDTLVPHCKPRFLVIIMLGLRGAGKTTQSDLLAREYNLLNISSGNIFRAGKQPFVELQKILAEEFGEEGKRRYNGVVLDRFVVNSKFDAFYVQSALDAVGLPVPFAFMLTIDPKLASKRAELREEKKKGHCYWRVIEQKTQTLTASTVYAPVGCLKTIEVTSQSTIENVFSQIKFTIDNELPADIQEITFSSAQRQEGKGMKLISDYKIYMKIVADVHKSVGNLYGRKDSAPLSTIASYVDKSFFLSANKSRQSQLQEFYVTLKADGERYLLAKHKVYGYIGFPFVFTHCYDLNKLFSGVELSCNFATQSTSNGRFFRPEMDIEFLFDTELVIHNDNPVFYVVDYVYFGGLEGKKIKFVERFKTLCDYFNKHAFAAHVVRLKGYVPINEVRRLIKESEGPCSFPTDGLVFQHNGNYKIGRDISLFKWKPMDICTADFRLENGFIEGDDWIFELMVTDDVLGENDFRETEYDGARARIPLSAVKEKNLFNGIIVEMALTDKTEGMDGKLLNTRTWWSLRNVRNDKSAPNKYSIVKKIVEMEHLSLEELLELCEKIPFSATTPC